MNKLLPILMFAVTFPYSGKAQKTLDLTLNFSGDNTALNVYVTARGGGFTSQNFGDLIFTVSWPDSYGYDSLGTYTGATNQWAALAPIALDTAVVNAGKRYATYGFAANSLAFGQTLFPGFTLPTLTQDVKTLIGSFDVTGAWAAGMTICDLRWVDDNFTITNSKDYFVQVGANPDETGNVYTRDGLLTEYDGATWTVCEIDKLQHVDTAVLNSGSHTLTNNVQVNKVRILPGAVLEVASGTTLTADTLSIEADATGYGQLAGDGTIANPVTAQVYLDASTPRWFNLGSPLTNATFEEFNEGNTITVSSGSNSSVFQWDANTANWASAGSSASEQMIQGKGYSFYAGEVTDGFGTRTYLRNGAGVLNVEGAVTTGNVSAPLGYNNGQSTGITFVGGVNLAETEGWNLVSNPYTATYNWDLHTVQSGMNDATHVWDNGTSSYATYINGVGNNGGTQYIAPFQAFWVQVSNTPPATLDFEAAARDAATAATPMYKTSPLDGAKLRVTDAAQHRDEMYIGFEMSSTVDFDGNWDARKLKNGTNVPNMFAEVLGQNYSICRVPEESITSFPVHLNDNNDGEIMSIEADLDQLKAYDQVVLEDLKTNAMHDLYSGSYSFTNDKSFTGNRFVLHFSNSSSVGLDELSTRKWYAYTSDEGIHINLGELESANVELYDMAGKRVMEASSDEGSVFFPVNMAKAIYVVRVSTASSTETQKLIK